MVILRLRTSSEKKELLKKIKKMYKFTKELKECIEDELEDDEEEDYDDLDYRHEEMDRMSPSYRGRGSGSRYRSGM